MNKNPEKGTMWGRTIERVEDLVYSSTPNSVISNLFFYLPESQYPNPDWDFYSQIQNTVQGK